MITYLPNLCKEHNNRPSYVYCIPLHKYAFHIGNIPITIVNIQYAPLPTTNLFLIEYIICNKLLGKAICFSDRNSPRN